MVEKSNKILQFWILIIHGHPVWKHKCAIPAPSQFRQLNPSFGYRNPSLAIPIYGFANKTQIGQQIHSLAIQTPDRVAKLGFNLLFYGLAHCNSNRAPNAQFRCPIQSFGSETGVKPPFLWFSSFETNNRVPNPCVPDLGFRAKPQIGRLNPSVATKTLERAPKLWI